MTKLNYAQQIKHPEWQKKRLQVLAFHGFKCQECGINDEELHVHHPFYKRGAMIWQYDNHELMCLCHKCHKETHCIDEDIKKLLSLTDDHRKKIVYGFLKAIHRTRDERPKNDSEKKGFLIGIGYLIASEEVPYV